MTGTLTDAGGVNGGLATVTIDGVLAGASNARLSVVIEGAALPGGGVQMDRGTVRLGTAGAPDLYRGEVTSLDGTRISAVARSQAGRRITLVMQFRVSGNAVSGSVSAVAGGSDDS